MNANGNMVINSKDYGDNNSLGYGEAMTSQIEIISQFRICLRTHCWVYNVALSAMKNEATYLFILIAITKGKKKTISCWKSKLSK